MLTSQIEVRKLSALLDQPASSLADLTAYPPEALRQLRHLCEEKCFASDRDRFHRWAQWTSLLPPPLMAALARRAGPLLTARIATEMPSHRGAAIARRLTAPFLARVCQHLDPQRSRELIRQLPPTLLVDTALTLIEAGAFMLLGRVADALDDDATRAVMDAVADDGHLLRIALFMESRTRLDHLVRLLPRERLARAVLLATDPDNDLMLEVIALLGNLGYELKHQLGDLVANQPAAVLKRIIQVAEQHQLWPDLVPVIAELSSATQQRLLELPILQQQPEILGHIITAADHHGLWSRLLPLVGMMNPVLLQEVGRQAAMLDRAAIERAMEAALTTEQWHALVRVAHHLPAQRQQDIAEIIDAYGKVDPALRQRLVTLANDNGLQALFA
ncbi:MAG: hypothetical protein ACFE0K_09100 [Alcanivorax sp.]|uniref:hypothetical protein n=1 Tax=Alcanivorax sp. TaxID=1872427 RepID=UPI003DA73E69